MAFKNSPLFSGWVEYQDDSSITSTLVEPYGFSDVNFSGWRESAQTISAIELNRCGPEIFYLTFSKGLLEKETTQLQEIDQIEGKLRRM